LCIDEHPHHRQGCERIEEEITDLVRLA